MGIIHNLDASQLQDILRRLRNLEAGSPMNNSAIGAGGIEVYDGGTINVSNGSIIVNGSLTGGGTFGWTGTFTQSGTTTFTGTSRFTGQTDIWGPLTVTGDTDLDGPTYVTGSFTVAGPTEITGTFDVTGVTKLAGNTTISGELDVTGAMSTKGSLSVEGVTTLKSDLDVVSGGKINVGQLQIEPSGGGQLNFTGGAISRSSSFGMLINDGSAVELAAPVVRLSGGNVQMPNLPTAANDANVYYDPSSNRLYYKP